MLETEILESCSMKRSRFLQKRAQSEEDEEPSSLHLDANEDQTRYLIHEEMESKDSPVWLLVK